jgi:hypothetical protein
MDHALHQAGILHQCFRLGMPLPPVRMVIFPGHSKARIQPVADHVERSEICVDG